SNLNRSFCEKVRAIPNGCHRTDLRRGQFARDGGPGRHRLPGSNAQRKHDGKNHTQGYEHAAMTLAQWTNHASFEFEARRCALHSSGGSWTPPTHRFSNNGQKAIAPGTIRMRNPHEPCAAWGSIRLTPSREKGIANKSPHAR